MAYLDFDSQFSLLFFRARVGDLDKNVAYYCNRYRCCRMTRGQSVRLSMGEVVVRDWGRKYPVFDYTDETLSERAVGG